MRNSFSEVSLCLVLFHKILIDNRLWIFDFFCPWCFNCLLARSFKGLFIIQNSHNSMSGFQEWFLSIFLSPIHFGRTLNFHSYISRKLAFYAFSMKILFFVSLSHCLARTSNLLDYGICLSNFVKTFPEPHSTNSSTPWDRMNCIVSVQRTEE